MESLQVACLPSFSNAKMKLWVVKRLQYPKLNANSNLTQVVSPKVAYLPQFSPTTRPSMASSPSEDIQLAAPTTCVLAFTSSRGQPFHVGLPVLLFSFTFWGLLDVFASYQLSSICFLTCAGLLVMTS